MCVAQLTYVGIVFWTSLILILGFVAILYRIFTGSKYQWLIALSLMLMLSNVFAIIGDRVAGVWTKDSDRKGYIFLEAFSFFLRDCLFNLAHWIFCYKYWLIAVQMQFMLSLKPMSPKRELLHKVINISFITLDIVMPMLYSISFICTWYFYDSSSEESLPQ